MLQARELRLTGAGNLPLRASPSELRVEGRFRLVFMVPLKVDSIRGICGSYYDIGFDRGISGEHLRLL